MLPILKAKLISVRRYFQDPAKTLVALAYLFVFAAVFAGTFLFSIGFLSYLNSFEEVSGVLFLHTLSLSFIVLFALSVFSFFISGVNLYFNDRILRIAFSSPLAPAKIFLAQFFETILLSSWPILLIGLPLLLGYAKTISASPNFYFYILIALSLFSLLSHSLATFLIILLAKIFKGVSAKISILLLFFFAVLFAVLFVKLILPPQFYELETAQNLIDLEQRVLALPSLSPLLPSTWVAKYLVGNDPASLFLLLILAVSSFLLTILLGGRYFYQIWLSFQEGRFIAKAQEAGFKVSRKIRFPFFEGKPFALVGKEFLRIVRTPSEIYALIFIFFLSLLYTLVLSKARLPTDPYLLRITQLFSFAALGFILTTFALRFAFPSLSLEGRGAWALFTAPLRAKTMIFTKFLFYFFLVEFFALGQFLSLQVFSKNLLAPRINPILMIAMALGVCAIAFGIGASFPNFSEESAEKASTSFPGIAATLLSLILVFGITLFSPFPALLASLVLGILLLSFAVKKAERFEF